MKRYPAALLNENGFTLIEALVAMVVLTIGILSIYSMQVVSIDSNSKSSHVTIASNSAAELVERIISTPHDDLIDSDGDGTNQDNGAPFGLDDDGGNFGLDDLTLATADGQATSGDYSVFWNVAEDYPVIGVKTVRVYVQDNNPDMNNLVTNTRTNSVTNRLVTIQYFKEGPL